MLTTQPFGLNVERSVLITVVPGLCLIYLDGEGGVLLSEGVEVSVSREEHQSHVSCKPSQARSCAGVPLPPPPLHMVQASRFGLGVSVEGTQRFTPGPPGGHQRESYWGGGGGHKPHDAVFTSRRVPGRVPGYPPPGTRPGGPPGTRGYPPDTTGYRYPAGYPDPGTRPGNP